MEKRLLTLLLCIVLPACQNSKTGAPTPSTTTPEVASPTSPPPAVEQAVSEQAVSEHSDNDLAVEPLGQYDNAQLLASCLSPDKLEEGWVRLFDGQSLWGWFYVGAANWQVREGALYVDSGAPSFLCTSFQISDYELLVDFKCPAGTNSGIFLRTTAEPLDVQTECYELNIAPTENPFPTGSLVKRQKVDPEVIGNVVPDVWHTYRIVVDGDQVKVWLDDKPVLEYTDPQPLRRGYISLQHNSGAIRFRNVLMRPLKTKQLTLGSDWESTWTKVEASGATLTATGGEGGLRIKGGPGRLETQEHWSDFVLQATYQLANPQVDSGILFRCAPNSLGKGYECQINHAVEGGQAAKPTDDGSGSIVWDARPNPQAARIVVGDGTKPTHVTLIASGGQFATWINGLQIADCSDDRKASDEPHADARVTSGPVALQGEDESTEVLFSRMAVSSIESAN